MDVHTFRLLLDIVHVPLGIALFTLGTAITMRPKTVLSGHPRLGTVYLGLLTVVLTTGMVIGATHPGVSPFEIATPPTLASGWLGWWAARRSGRRAFGRSWRDWHVRGMAGSFIGVVTATLFQTVGRVVPQTATVVIALFTLPTIVGSVIIARLDRQRRQRRATAAVIGRGVALSQQRGTVQAVKT